MHFYVQPIMRDGKRLVPGQRREAIDENTALAIAADLAERMVGVVAVAVELDDDGNPIDEPRIIVRYGEVPGLS
jgi:hypothetical protein